MNKLTEELIKPFLDEVGEDKKIKTIVGIYPGRFQPCGRHHAQTFKWLQKKFGKNTFVATSNKVQLPKSPLNFKEKQMVWKKHGVPSNKVVQVKNPYLAEEVLKKFDPETTAVVFIFGAKDAGRLSGGKKAGGGAKYFQPLKGNEKDIKGYKEHGYFLVAPHISIKVGGKEISGTMMRTALGSTKIDNKKKKVLFKEIFGWYDDKLFNLLTKKFEKSVKENIDENVSSGQLQQVEKYLDKLWGRVGIDVQFTRHFFDRVNDKRNKKPISPAEVIKIFRNTYKKYGKVISKLGDQAQAVLKDMETDVNVPFVLKWDGGEFDLVAKTIMRKKNFKTPNKKFAVEGVDLPIKVGDTIRMGKFKNKKVVVKSIDWNEKGDLLINGKPALKFRLSTDKEIEEFITTIDMNELLTEASDTTKGSVDDGPVTFYVDYKNYKKHSTSRAKELGYEVIGYIMNDDVMFHTLRNPYPKGPINSVTYFPAGVGTGKSPNHQEEYTGTKAWNKWATHINHVAGIVGWKFLEFLEDEKDIAVSDSKKTQQASKDEEPEEVKESFTKDWWKEQLITEGGSFGHLQHPFDNKKLTFGDFKQIITLGLSGRLDVEGDVTEKTDGQAIAISWKDGKIIAARNKGDRKNFGANALDLKGIISKFKGRGDIRDAFVFAMKDLQKAVSSLSKKQQNKIFAEGEKFMNLEIIWPASVNVINYDKAVLQFHGSTRYDRNGNPVEYVKSDARILEGMIRRINQHIQKKFTIIKPQVLNIPRHQDFTKKRKYFLNKLNKLQKQFNLSDSDQFGMYHQRFWEEFIYNAGKQYNYEVPFKVLKGLTKRWAFFDKSYKISTIKKDIDNEQFLDWFLKTDKENHKKYVQQNMLPFEKLFFELGAEILSNMSGFLATNPDKTIMKLKKDVDKEIKNIRGSKDPQKIELLNKHLEKINSYGGFEKIVPSEGLTFLYKGELYKITGNFGPLNALLGILKFSR